MFMQSKNTKKISVLLLFSILISLFSNVVSALNVNGEAVESVGESTQQDVTIGDVSQDATIETDGFLADGTLNYGVTPENDVTLLMSEKTVFSEFKQKLGSDKVLNITRDGSEIPSDDIIRTGDIISINGEESIAEVVGDVDGDGLITSTDYLQIKSYFFNQIELDGVYFSAGDTDNNGEISSIDYIRIKCCFCKIFSFFASESEKDVEEELAEEIFVPKCNTDFSFLVNFNGSLAELLENVKVYHVVDDTNILVNYSAVSEEDSAYRISPESAYENYEIYTVELSGDASFADYKAKSITFEIGGPDKNNIDFENDIIFLKNLESLSPGYYPYTINFDEEKELYILTLSKGDGFTDALIGKILAVGDYSSEAEVLADSSRELYFGKIQKIYQSGKSTVVEMTVPELDELFTTLDVFTNQYSGDTEIEFNEDLENEIIGAIQASDTFVEHIAAANLAAKDYALEHGIVAVDVVGKSFKDYFKFELTKKEFKHQGGGWCTVNIEGTLTCTIPLKTKGGTDIGDIKIICTAGIKSDISFYGYLNLRGLHLGVTTKTTVNLGFKLTIKADASLNDEMHYYVTKSTGTIHTETCRYVKEVVDASNLDKHTAESLLKLYPDKEAMKKDECKVCKAVTGLNGTAYVLNISSNTLHCLNCIHVSTIAEHNIFEIYPERVDGYNLCEDCKPQEREAKDFEQRMLNRMQGGDWAAEVEKLRSLMQNSGNETDGNGKGMDIGYVPFNLFWVFNIDFTLELVCNFDLEATLDCSFTFYSEDQFGVTISFGNSRSYHNQIDKWDKKTIDVTGKADLELGLNLNIRASALGLAKKINVHFDAGVGAYATLSGVLHFESGTAEELNNYYAAYFEMGFYYDISCGYKFFRWSGDATIIKNRIPFLKRGYERAYYSFQNYAPTLDINLSYTHLGNTDILDVEYFNVKELKKGTDKLNSEGDAQYYVKYAFKNADGTINPYFSYGQGGIKISDDAPKIFTAYMEITVVPKHAPVSSMSEFLSQDYKNGSSVFFLDTLTVELNVIDEDIDADYELGSLKANLTDGVLTIWGEGDMPNYSFSTNVPWYTKRNEITMVVIGDGVTSIGRNAFLSCKSLVSITIPDSVTSIGEYAFYNCTSLGSVTIPDNVTSIEEYAFYNCTSLGSVTIPDNVTSIQEYVFYNCTSLRSVTIPDNVTSIWYGAFEGCTSLESVTIPDNVTSIWGNVFGGCDSLASIEVSSGNYLYHSKNNCLIETSTKTLIAGCKNSVIPTDGSVTSIWYGAFSGCASLESIIIPDSVTSIGNGVFDFCTSLENIVVSSGNKVYHSANNCLIETSTKTLIAGCKNSVIPTDGSVTSIGYCAFFNCDSLASITIPDSVTSIGEDAFSGCVSLASVTIGDSLTSIGDYAFSDCYSLASVTIGDSLTSIGDYAFSDCNSLASITIPDSVTSIGDYAFSGCVSLESVTIGDSVTSIGYCAFFNCDSLASITIPDSVTSIGEDAFDDCDSLASVTIGDSVTSIGRSAFDDCASLESVIFEDPNGWYVTKTEGASSGTKVTVTDKSTAADYLTNTYCWYYWYRK